MQLVNDDVKFNPPEDKSITKTIKRTLKTAKLIDAFWERWIVHGLDMKDLCEVRNHLNTAEEWFSSWESLALKKIKIAKELEADGNLTKAEYAYRQASLYYNINYWLNPKKTEQKQNWYKLCLYYTSIADSLSKYKTIYKRLTVNNSFICSGRIRIPTNPKGCIVIINPIDSTKEELFKYEMDFVEAGYITLSFDGPGQGETFINNSVIGTRQKWEQMINHVIDYANEEFKGLPINLFGTSLGGSWVLYGSSHKSVSKSVAVSPAGNLEDLNMPSYFMDRMYCSCFVDDIDTRAMPKLNGADSKAPIMIFHGCKDMMVTTDVMNQLFDAIISEKQLIKYESEGHVCNNKLDEIRKLSLSWFDGDYEMMGSSII